MINSSGRVDQALGIQLQKVYKTISNAAIRRTDHADSVTISEFSALVEKTRTAAMKLPDVRADRVASVKSQLENGNLAQGTDVASAMIDRAVEGQV